MKPEPFIRLDERPLIPTLSAATTDTLAVAEYLRILDLLAENIARPPTVAPLPSLDGREFIDYYCDRFYLHHFQCGGFGDITSARDHYATCMEVACDLRGVYFNGTTPIQAPWPYPRRESGITGRIEFVLSHAEAGRRVHGMTEARYRERVMRLSRVARWEANR